MTLKLTLLKLICPSFVVKIQKVTFKKNTNFVTKIKKNVIFFCLLLTEENKSKKQTEH